MLLKCLSFASLARALIWCFHKIRLIHRLYFNLSQFRSRFRNFIYHGKGRIFIFAFEQPRSFSSSYKNIFYFAKFGAKNSIKLKRFDEISLSGQFGLSKKIFYHFIFFYKNTRTFSYKTRNTSKIRPTRLN